VNQKLIYSGFCSSFKSIRLKHNIHRSWLWMWI